MRMQFKTSTVGISELGWMVFADVYEYHPKQLRYIRMRAGWLQQHPKIDTHHMNLRED